MNISMPEEVGFMCYRLQGLRPAPLEPIKADTPAPSVSYSICSQPHLRKGLGGLRRNPFQQAALSLAEDFTTSQHLITPSTSPIESETVGIL